MIMGVAGEFTGGLWEGRDGLREILLRSWLWLLYSVCVGLEKCKGEAVGLRIDRYLASKISIAVYAGFACFRGFLIAVTSS